MILKIAEEAHHPPIYVRTKFTQEIHIMFSSFHKDVNTSHSPIYVRTKFTLALTPLLFYNLYKRKPLRRQNKC